MAFALLFFPATLITTVIFSSFTVFFSTIQIVGKIRLSSSERSLYDEILA